jgi:hypothetical protein
MDAVHLNVNHLLCRKDSPINLKMNFFVADEAANPFVAADRRVQQSRYTNRP